jgi:glycosyltransferase domain-containing protein
MLIDLTSKITIVIPTFERINNLNLLLSFFENSKIKVNLLILDSSKKNQKKKLFISKKNVIRYIKFDSKTFISKKINKGLKLVKTPFTSVCPDDDFLILDTINICLKFLMKDKSYSCAMGLHYLYDYYYLKKFKKIFVSVLDYSKKSNRNENLITRIDNYIFRKNDFYGHYAVFRTKTLKTVWSYTAKYSNDYNFSEINSTIVSLVVGKVKSIKKPYLIRTPNINFVKSKKIMKKKDFSKNIILFQKCLKKIFLYKKIKVGKNFIKDRSEVLLKKLIEKQTINENFNIHKFVKYFIFLDYFILFIKLKFLMPLELKENKNFLYLKKLIISNYKKKFDEIISSRNEY